jgi:hypothetical protein
MMQIVEQRSHHEFLKITQYFHCSLSAVASDHGINRSVSVGQPTANPRPGQRIKDLRHSEYTLPG